MFFVLFFLTFFLIYKWKFRNFRNPYKLYMIFGKKGSGKSSYLAKLALRYLKHGYHVYTNMSDLAIPGVRFIDARLLGDFVPVPDSVVLLDEVGMLYDNRNFKEFKNSVRDFFKLQRHYRCIVYLASQSFDVDKKLRDLTDRMFLAVGVGNTISVLKPISKKITLTDASSLGESRIADNLKFAPVFAWKITFIPNYAKYFQSFLAPDLPHLEYTEYKSGLLHPSDGA